MGWSMCYTSKSIVQQQGEKGKFTAVNSERDNDGTVLCQSTNWRVVLS